MKKKGEVADTPSLQKGEGTEKKNEDSLPLREKEYAIRQKGNK